MAPPSRPPLPGGRPPAHPGKQSPQPGTSRPGHLEREGSEQQDSALKFPRSVAYIVGNEFCERFSFYGMKAILFLYFVNHFGMTEDHSKESVHLFIVACYMAPLLGAFISDSYLGKYKTILYLSIVYCLGNWAMAVSALPGPASSRVHAWHGTLLGLGLIALGTGGIKPCVAAFGGDQVKEMFPESAARDLLLRRFFSAFYFAINAGATISTVLTPELRIYISYSVAFSVPAVLMMVATVLFLAGTPMYKHQPPAGNIMTHILGVIWAAIGNRGNKTRPGTGAVPYSHLEDNSRLENGALSQSGAEEDITADVKETTQALRPADGDRPASHWLDAAKARFSDREVEDVKALLAVLVLFAPAPIFWTLFDQQSSSWIDQANHMEGRVFWGITVIPEQMQTLNSCCILIMIPLFDNWIYPFLERHRVSLRPIRRMVMGMAMSAIAFIISGAIQRVMDGGSGHPPNFQGLQAQLLASAVTNSTAGHLTLPVADPLLQAPRILFETAANATKTGCALLPKSGRCISILWQVPQYVVMTAGEILFSITGLELAYSEAPASMRAAVQSAWLLTVASGNLMTVVVVALIGTRIAPSNQFFLFAAGCVMAMGAMMLVGRGFVYQHHRREHHVRHHSSVPVPNPPIKIGPAGPLEVEELESGMDGGASSSAGSDSPVVPHGIAVKSFSESFFFKRDGQDPEES